MVNITEEDIKKSAEKLGDPQKRQELQNHIDKSMEKYAKNQREKDEKLDLQKTGVLLITIIQQLKRIRKLGDPEKTKKIEEIMKAVNFETSW